MPQFTDPPYFLLKNFFEDTLVAGTPPVLEIDEDSLFWQDCIFQDSEDWKWKDFNFWSWVRWVIYTQAGWSDGCTLKGQYPGAGQGHGIAVDGGGATELWVLTPGSDEEFIPIKLNFDEINGNFFQFFQNYTIDINTWEPGSPTFFRKNSAFHYWLKQQRDDTVNPTVDRTVERYANTERPFMYFGPIFPTGTESTSPSGQHHHIEFWGMKDWTKSAVPQHTQTERVEELFNLFFDRLYHEAYQALKEIPTLLDPIEVDINYLGKITQLFNVTLIEEIPDELRKRQFTQSIINFLKRKGTYSSLYAIYRIMLGNTSNRLNVYERWHKGKNPPGDHTGNQALTTPVSPWFNDILYTAYYGEDPIAPSGSANFGCRYPVGNEFYGSKGTSAYPPQYGDNDPTTIVPTSAADYLSPHYKVEIDLSCEPLGEVGGVLGLEATGNFIIDQTTIESLLDYWEMIRPVARVSHYRYLISPITDFNGSWFPLYSAEYSSIMNSICTDPVIAAEAGAAVYVQTFNSAEWIFYHNLGSQNIIVQTFDTSFNLTFPQDIIVDDANTVRIIFDKPVAGYAYALTDTGVQQVAAVTNWNVAHNQGEWDVLSQFDHIEAAERKKLMPIRVDLITNNSLQAEFTPARSGWTITSLADYTHEQPLAQTTWQVNHNLEVTGVQVQCVDSSREVITPKTVTAINQDTVIVEFDDAITGWALVKAIGKPLTQDGVIDPIRVGGYIKFGNGTDLDTWNPIFNNDLKSPIYQIDLPHFTITKRNDMYFISAETQAIFEGDVTEIGVFNDVGNLIFYTMCSPFYKPSDVGITLHYRILR